MTPEHRAEWVTLSHGEAGESLSRMHELRKQYESLVTEASKIEAVEQIERHAPRALELATMSIMTLDDRAAWLEGRDRSELSARYDHLLLPEVVIPYLIDQIDRDAAGWLMDVPGGIILDLSTVVGLSAQMRVLDDAFGPVFCVGLGFVDHSWFIEAPTKDDAEALASLYQPA